MGTVLCQTPSASVRVRHGELLGTVVLRYDPHDVCLLREAEHKMRCGLLTQQWLQISWNRHSCTRFFEFWTATFWMIHGSGKTLPSGESAALRHPCIYIQRHCYGWWYFSISVGVTKEIAHWPIPNRLRWPFRLQPWWLFADREDALCCSAFKAPFQRILIAGCQVYHWCLQQFTVTLPLVKLWLLHYTAEYTRFCIYGTVMATQWPKSLTKAIHYLSSTEAERPVVH